MNARGRALLLRPTRVLAILALTAGCGPRSGLRSASLAEPEVASRSLLRSPALEAVAARLIGEAEAARRSGDLPRADPPLLIPPLGPDSRVADAAALTWALLRLGPSLQPYAPSRSLPSVPAVQAWLRQVAPPGPVVWLVEIHAVGPTAQLVVLAQGGAWRSSEIELPATPLDTAWPLAVPAMPPAGATAVTRAECIRRVEGDLWLESRRGRRRITRGGGGLELGELQPWEHWNRTWIERFEGRPAAAVPAFADEVGDARLELRTQERVGRPQRQRWWIVRGGGALPLPVARDLPARIRSVAPAPESWAPAAAWVVLFEGAGQQWLDVLSAPLRWVPSLPARSVPAAEAPTITQAGRFDPDPGWPRDRWGLWQRVHVGMTLARWDVTAQAARAEPMARFVRKDDGRRWQVHLVLPGAAGGRPGLDVADVERALRQRIDAGAAAGAYGWLVGPLQGARIEAHSWGLDLRFAVAVPDLVERLAHPVMALIDPRLCARYATHRLVGRGLLPRVSGEARLVVVSGPYGDTPAGFFAGGYDLLRPYRGQLDVRSVELASGGQVWWSVATGPSAQLQIHTESPTQVVLLCQGDAPAPLRRRLVAARRALDTLDLLALPDTALAPRAPASGRELESELARAASGPDRSGARPERRDPESEDAASSPFALVLEDPAPGEDPNGEIARAGERLRHVLAPFHVTVGRAGSAEVGGFDDHHRVRGRIRRLHLCSGEILLRVLELASWIDDSPPPGSLAAAARLAVDAPDRVEAALDGEARLVADGLVIPLWREPGLVLIDASVSRAGPVLPGLPILLEEARVDPEASGAREP